MVTVGTKVIFQLKNSNDTVGNRTRDLPGCCAVPQQKYATQSPCKTKKFHKILVNVGMTQRSKVPIDLYWFNYYNVSFPFLITFVW